MINSVFPSLASFETDPWDTVLTFINYELSEPNILLIMGYNTLSRAYLNRHSSLEQLGWGMSLVVVHLIFRLSCNLA